MKKGILFFMVPVVALALAACPDSSSSSGGGGNGNPGVFSVALASKVKATSTKLAATADAANNVAEGLVFGTSTAMQAAGNALEVWLTDTTYIKDDGDAKDKTVGSAYKVIWDAYDPAGASDPMTTSVKGAAAAGKVTIAASTTGKAARMNVIVGTDFLAKAGGAVIVVSIYEPTATATALTDATGRLAQYKLTITKAAAPVLTTAIKVSAKGLAKATPAPTQTELTGAAALTPTAITVVAANKNTGTVTLPELATVATDGQKVAFNNFVVTGSPDGMTWEQLEGVGTAGLYLDGLVIANGNTAASAATAVALTAAARADYEADTGKKGSKVKLLGKDKYGQAVEITVTLSDVAT